MNEDKHLSEFEILKMYGLSKNEIHTYLSVISLGLCEARQICGKTRIPSSKIYNILEKLEEFGLIEIQETRPKKYQPVPLTIALDNLTKLKEKEFRWFKSKIPILRNFLKSQMTDYEVNSVFWNITIGEDEIFSRHISRFQFVEILGMICIDFSMLENMTKNSKMAEEISLDFKQKRIKTSLIICYETLTQKEKILAWINQRPRKLDANNQIRLLNEKIPVPFGLFDLNKVILLMRHPVKDEFLCSIYMVNKQLYDDMIPYFNELWERSDSNLNEL